MDNVGYVAAGYLLTGAAIGGYLWSLLARARRARRTAERGQAQPEPSARV